MFKVDIDANRLLATLSSLEREQFPFACMLAINDSMFDVRHAWDQGVVEAFDRPTPLTRKAVLYKKATKQDLTAEVFIRDEVANGTPPSRYLFHEVTGGAREEKPFEQILREAGVLGANEFIVPAKGFPLNEFGN